MATVCTSSASRLAGRVLKDVEHTQFKQVWNIWQTSMRPKRISRRGISQITRMWQVRPCWENFWALCEPVMQQSVAVRLMAAEDIVDKLQRIANTDITDFLTWKGDTLIVKDPSEIPKELRQCIESITQHETQHVKYLKIKLHSKVAALGMLAKYHNLFKRSIASKGLSVHIHVAGPSGQPKAPVVVNPLKNGPPAPIPRI